MEGLERDLFSIASALGDINSNLESVSTLSDINSNLESINASLSTMVEGYESLDMEEIYTYGFERFLRDDIVPKLTCATMKKVTFYFISATTMDNDTKPALHDNYIYLRPRQWKLLKKTHERELNRWCRDQKKPFEIFLEHMVFVNVLKIQKTDPVKDVLCLHVDFQIRFATSFYFGRHYCQAAIQFVACEAGVEKCDLACTLCETCKRRLVCKTHQKFEEKTMCECKKNK